MLKRLFLTALAAVAVLATAALTPASAHGGRGGGFSHGGGHFGHARYFGNRFAHFHHEHGHRWNWHWRHGSRGWGHGTVYYGGYGGDNYAATPVAASCPGNCLAKEYLPNGMVVFTDRCTNESAAAPTQPQPRG